MIPLAFDLTAGNLLLVLLVAYCLLEFRGR